jgi:hypothetical protein
MWCRYSSYDTYTIFIAYGSKLHMRSWSILSDNCHKVIRSLYHNSKFKRFVTVYQTSYNSVHVWKHWSIKCCWSFWSTVYVLLYVTVYFKLLVANIFLNRNDQLSINTQGCIVNFHRHVACSHTFGFEMKRRSSGREVIWYQRTLRYIG